MLVPRAERTARLARDERVLAMMNWLAENALPIWVGGAVALTMALVVYLQTRTQRVRCRRSVAVVAIVAALLVTERLMETPREAVERTLYELAATVEANDVPGALGFLAPTADTQIRERCRNADAAGEDRAGAHHRHAENRGRSGDASDTATVQCRGLIVATDKQNGMKGGAEDELTMQLGPPRRPLAGREIHVAKELEPRCGGDRYVSRSRPSIAGPRRQSTVRLTSPCDVGLPSMPSAAMVPVIPAAMPRWAEPGPPLTRETAAGNAVIQGRRNHSRAMPPPGWPPP